MWLLPGIVVRRLSIVDCRLSNAIIDGKATNRGATKDLTKGCCLSPLPFELGKERRPA
jgi:hypothetical protein